MFFKLAHAAVFLLSRHIKPNIALFNYSALFCQVNLVSFVLPEDLTQLKCVQLTQCCYYCKVGEILDVLANTAELSETWVMQVY